MVTCKSECNVKVQKCPYVTAILLVSKVIFNSVSTITATFKLVSWASPIPSCSADHFQYRHMEEGLET